MAPQERQVTDSVRWLGTLYSSLRDPAFSLVFHTFGWFIPKSEYVTRRRREKSGRERLRKDLGKLLEVILTLRRLSLVTKANHSPLGSKEHRRFLSPPAGVADDIIGRGGN